MSFDKIFIEDKDWINETEDIGDIIENKVSEYISNELNIFICGIKLSIIKKSFD